MKTTTKPATKPAAKPAAKTAAKPATLVYAALLAEALAGKHGTIIQRFYVNAMQYHAKAKTAFPRARLADVELMPIADAREFIAKHAATSIPPGSRAGQRLYDAMMVEAAASK